MKRLLGAQFYACGKKGLPEKISVNGGWYRFVREFKHDFFAATGLYELSNGNGLDADIPRRIVLKMSRQQNILGLPMKWFGGGLCEREISNLKRLSDIRQVPRLLGCYGKCGMIYEYIEGRVLNEAEELSEDFFEKLRVLLKELHRRNVIYVDMNKCENIIVGEDGEPYLIDFQVSVYVPRRILISRRLSRWLADIFKRADIYHLYKLKRKIQPKHLTEEEHKISRDKSRLIRLHRMGATPLRKLRRSFKQLLREHGYLFRES
jgi:RIO-like serine/threonine protein kinase